MKYLLSILILFSGLCFANDIDVAKERHSNLNEEDILLVCDFPTSNGKKKLEERHLFIITSEIKYSLRTYYDEEEIKVISKLVVIEEKAQSYAMPNPDPEINRPISINRFNLVLDTGDNYFRSCRNVNKTDYLFAEDEMLKMAGEIRAKRKI